MTVETHIRQAIDRVHEEQAAIDGKQAAYRRFVTGVEGVAVETPTGQRGGLRTGPAATVAASSSGGSNSRQQVRERFAETVRPHSTADVDDPETLLETIGVELSEQVAMALAPQNMTGFTANLKQGVLSEAAQRRHELRAMERALDREEASLVAANDAIDELLAWIVDANETALTDCGFEVLRARHERLDGFHDRCGTIAHERQSLLHATTSVDAQVGITQQELVNCLYDGFPVAYPVLSTIVRVKQICDECQRAIRAHLVRRV
ncbi:hypothetical protein C448_11856 [Halococcus morrhuae DSM 1307]|uniref:DUF7260 domain-containing protein n=1 Tax=Halococcus morrhuae DSM 1307 TaxID=931277 RepID=M0MC37_HALMO|nr:hypothetical protein [Halococcus morrhuae]EMA42224.1 hypothetical protein C448_11856 [Halococcus morrhuae DSM 1307]